MKQSSPGAQGKDSPPPERQYETIRSMTSGRQGLPELANEVGYGNQVFTFERHKKPVAALVPIDALRLIVEGKEANISKRDRDLIIEHSRRALEELKSFKSK